MSEEERSSTHLNDAQVKVLEWVKAGCPDGIFSDESYSHRTSARALHNRGLLRVSGRGDSWTAELTDRGRAWPAETEQDILARQAKAKTASIVEAQESAKLPPTVPKPPKPAAKPAKPSTVSLAARDLVAAEELVSKVLTAGNQQLPTADLELGPQKLRRIVAASLAASNRPFGRQLTVRNLGPYGRGEEIVSFSFYFRDFVVETAVPVQERVSKYHPAVKEFLVDKEWQYVTKEHVSRAAHILQAIATEAIRRGFTVIPHSKKPDDRYRTASAVEHGNFWIDTEFGYYGIEIKEISAPGAKKFRDLDMSWQQIQRLPSWIGRRGWEFISSGRLQLGQGKSLSTYGEANLSDSRGTTLEEKLPEVFVRFDIWMLEQAERVRLERLSKERKQQRWEAAMANAKTDYVIAERWKHFVSLAEQDKQFRRYREFLRRAEAAVDDLPPEKRFAASGFLTEIEATMASLDPLASSDQLLPNVPEPKPDDLKPYLGGWSPFGPDR